MSFSRSASGACAESLDAYGLLEQLQLAVDVMAEALSPGSCRGPEDWDRLLTESSPQDLAWDRSFGSLPEILSPSALQQQAEDADRRAQASCN